MLFGLIGQRVRRVRDRPARPQRGGDHRGLDYFGLGGASLAHVAAVDIDAIRTLSRKGNCDGNQLLVLHRNCAVGDGRFVESQNAFITSGARLFIFFIFASFALLYMVWLVLLLWHHWNGWINDLRRQVDCVGVSIEAFALQSLYLFQRFCVVAHLGIILR